MKDNQQTDSDGAELTEGKTEKGSFDVKVSTESSALSIEEECGAFADAEVPDTASASKVSAADTKEVTVGTLNGSLPPVLPAAEVGSLEQMELFSDNELSSVLDFDNVPSSTMD